MKTTFFIVAIATLLTVSLQAQTADKASADPSSGIVASKIPASSMSVQLLAGTQGIGLEYKYQVHPKITARIGCAYAPFKYNRIFTEKNVNGSVKSDATFTNIHLWGDFSPFPFNKTVRFVAGVAYFIKSDGNFHIAPTDNMYFGQMELTPAYLGEANVKVNWKGIAPYAGMAWGRNFPKGRFNVNVELGTYYLTAPSTSIEASEALQPSASEKNNLLIQQNITAYRWYPVLQIAFNYKFL